MAVLPARFFAGCLLASAALAQAEDQRSSSQARDNVLIILADDLGVDSVGVYGEGTAPAPTPNIDALAQRGVLFRNAWANPMCSTTRACLLTGRYSLRTGIGATVAPNESMSPAETSLPRFLDRKRSGYTHAAFGKWHLGDPAGDGTAPNTAGWSHFAGFVGAGQIDYFQWPRTVNGVTNPIEAYATTQIVNDALNWIQTAPEPWVVYLSLNAPHAPFHAPPRRLHSQTLPPSPLVDPVPFHRAMIEAMDTELGRMFGALGSSLLARTNVMFLADNGTRGNVIEEPFARGRGKGTMFEGGLNVPLIVAGPAVGSPGREDASLVHAVDVFATVAQLCGVEPQVALTKIDSVSFLPHILAPNQAPVRSSVYAELFADGMSGVPDPLLVDSVAIRDARFKLIRDALATPAVETFYDLSADPFELAPLPLGALTPIQQAGYNALLAEIGVIKDARGSLTAFGASSCVGSNGTPSIFGNDSPMVGSSYEVHLRDGPAAQPAFLVLAQSRTRWGGAALPFPLFSIGAGPGCYLFTSTDWFFGVATSPAGEAVVPIAVPDLPLLIGGMAYHTWLVVDPGAPNNPAGLVATNALEVVFGK